MPAVPSGLMLTVSPRQNDQVKMRPTARAGYSPQRLTVRAHAPQAATLLPILAVGWPAPPAPPTSPVHHALTIQTDSFGADPTTSPMRSDQCHIGG